MINFLVYYCFVEISYGVNENFVCQPFKFKVHQEKLTWTPFFVEIHIIHFADDNVRVNKCYLDKKIHLERFYVVAERNFLKTLMTSFTLERNIKFWSTALLSDMIIQMILGLCSESRTVG